MSEINNWAINKFASMSSSSSPDAVSCLSGRESEKINKQRLGDA